MHLGRTLKRGAVCGDAQLQGPQGQASGVGPDPGGWLWAPGDLQIASGHRSSFRTGFLRTTCGVAKDYGSLTLPFPQQSFRSRGSKPGWVAGSLGARVRLGREGELKGPEHVGPEHADNPTSCEVMNCDLVRRLWPSKTITYLVLHRPAFDWMISFQSRGSGHLC